MWFKSEYKANMESKQHIITLVIVEEENRKLVEETDAHSSMDGSAPKKNQGFKRPLPFIPKYPAAKKAKIEAQPCVIQERKLAISVSSRRVDSVRPHPENAIVEDHRVGELVLSVASSLVTGSSIWEPNIGNSAKKIKHLIKNFSRLTNKLKK